METKQEGGSSSGGRLVLSETAPLPSGSLFSLDGRDALVGPRFRGVQKVPSGGWHAVGWSGASASSSSGAPTDSTVGMPSLDGGIRNVVLRRWGTDQEILYEYEASSDALRPVSLSSAVVRQDTSSAEQHLVPYPIPLDPTSYAQSNRRIQEINMEDKDAQFSCSWKASVANLDRLSIADADGLLARIFNVATATRGANQSAPLLWTDSLADVLAPASVIVPSDPADQSNAAQPHRDPHGRAYWGAERHVTPVPEDSMQNLLEVEPVSLLHFTPFDLKRSWPTDSNGTQRTRWSVDKSWLLEDVICRAGGEPSLLAEFDILFLLFRTAHNGPCLDRWREMVSLFCRSGERLGAPGSFELHPAVQQFLNSDTPSSPASVSRVSSHDMNTKAFSEQTQCRLESLHATFFNSLRAHLSILPPDFFQADTEGFRLEIFLLDELSILRSHLGACLSRLAVVDLRSKNTDPAERDEGTDDYSATATPRPDLLLPAYRSLTHMTRSRFGWNLEGLKGEEELAMREAGIWVSGKSAMRSRGGADETEEEDGKAAGEGDEDEEDEEDRPVVVPFEEVEAATLRTGG